MLWYYLFLVVCAVVPVIGLCLFIYLKDTNKEPFGLVAKLFAFGFLGVIPVVIAELAIGFIFDNILNISETSSFILTFIDVFFGVALIEEGYKWILTKFFGYDNKEFDEIYDIIVYSVFASLGFACVENILYVLGNGFTNAVMRALLSVPGHACFAVIMGFFFAQAKINTINNRKGIAGGFLLLSILCPAIVHTIYDALLMHFVNVGNINGFTFGVLIYLLIFFVFDIMMVISCFVIVIIISKIQQNLTTNVQKGTVLPDQNGHVKVNVNADIHFCPVCGKTVDGSNFCSSCGCKLR